MTKKLHVANPDSITLRRGCNPIKAYVFAFGVYVDDHVVAYGWGLFEALEAAVAWLAENKPGHLVGEDEVQALKRATMDIYPDLDPITAYERAIEDLTNVGDHYLASWEWTIVAEEASPAEIAKIGRALRARACA